MKKMIALSMASMMLLSMSTVALADIETGIVNEEKAEWPNQLHFGGELTVVRSENAEKKVLEEKNTLNLMPGDSVYLPLYFETKEGESVTIGASKEQMSGVVPYSGEIGKGWKVNLADRSRQMVETAELYKAKSSDKDLVKNSVYVKLQTAQEYPSLEGLSFDIGVFVSERYTQNKTAPVTLRGTFENPKSDKPIDFEWENSVYTKSVWETNEEEDGTATFNFGDDAYFTVKMFGGDKVMFDFDRTYNKDIASKYAEDLYFYNFRGNLDEFSATGLLTLPTEGEMYLYEVVNGALKATDAVYNEEEEGMQLRTRKLGEYVLSPVALEIGEEAEAIEEEVAVEERTTESYSDTTDYYASGNDKKNPSTGAEDYTSLMVALAVLSVTGGVVLMKKR